jgi:hypothetical protein
MNVFTDSAASKLIKQEQYVPNYRGGSVVVKKKMKPEWTVKGGRMQSVDIRIPVFRPRLDDGVAPWDQIY